MSFVDTLKREELEIVLLVEPAAFKEFKRQPGPASESERIDRELHVGVRLLPRIRLVVEDVDVPVADLQEVDVSRYHVAL